MKGLKGIHKHLVVKDSMEKMGKILQKEFPYTKIIFDHRKKNGHYHVHLEHIRPDDVDKFIELSFDISRLHGIGANIPVLMRYKKIEESLV